MPDDRVPPPAEPVAAQRVTDLRVGFRPRRDPGPRAHPGADVIEDGDPAGEAWTQVSPGVGGDPAQRVHAARTGKPIRPLLATLVAAVLVGVAIAKPWGGAPEQAAAAAPAPPAATPATAVTAPTTPPRMTAHSAHSYGGWLMGPVLSAIAPWYPAGGIETASCYAPRGWRVIVDRAVASGPGSRGATSRSWIPLRPAPAVSATDPAVRYVHASSALVTAIGTCSAIASTTPRTAVVWRVVPDPDGAGLRSYIAGSLLLPGGEAAGAVAPARYSGCAWDANGMQPGCSPTATWPAGRYVIEVIGPDGSRDPTFLGLILEPAAP